MENFNNESVMSNKGTNKVLNSVKTKANNDKNLASTSAGMYLVSKEAIRLTQIMADNTAHRKPNWYKVVDLDIMGSAIYLLASMVTLHNTDIKYKRHTVINKVSKELFNDDLKLGLSFTEWLVDNSEMFTKNTKIVKGKKEITYSLNSEISDEIIEKLNLQAAKAFYPLPLNVAPLDWVKEESGAYTGGYHTKQYPIVRKGKDKDQDISEEVLDSINIIQSTPWKVNKVVLEALKRDVVAPKKDDFITQVYPTDGDKVQVAEYYRQKDTFISECGKYQALKLAMDIAEDVKDEDQIFFPHSMDSRGRVYPISIALQPQSESRIKALLMFKDSVILTEDGANQCYAYIGALWGEDKLPFEERVACGKTVIYNDYKDADEPYEFLALQTEMLAWEEDNNTPIHAHIHVDGSSNALQWMSAITGDHNGCVASNVLPTELGRQDIYTEVAIEALNRVSKDLTPEGQYIKRCLETEPRKYAKKVVMTAGYGSTLYGDTTTLLGKMSEFNFEAEFISIPVASKFAKLLRDSLTAKTKGAAKYMAWAKELCKEHVNDTNSAFSYYTQDGFKVRIKKDEYKVEKIKIKLNGVQNTLSLNTKTGKVSANKTASAVAPGFIHSLDATMLREVTRRCDADGITSFGMIHDAYSVNPNEVRTLLKHTRESFLDMNSKDIVEDLRTQINPDSDKFEMIGELDLTSVLCSEWFFC